MSVIIAVKTEKCSDAASTVTHFLWNMVHAYKGYCQEMVALYNMHSYYEMFQIISI